MLSLSFDNQLRTHVNRRNNDYRYDLLTETSIIIPPNAKRIPYIFKEPGNVHRELGVLRYSNNRSQLNGTKATKLQLAEVFNSARIPIIVRYTSFILLVGKGFLAELSPDGTVSPLVFVQSPNRDDVELRDLEFIVDRKLYSSEYRYIQSAVGIFIDSHVGEVLITPNIMKYLGEKIKVPRFSRLSERAAFVNNLILQSFNKIKESCQ